MIVTFDASQLQGTVVGHYVLERLLGSGGMGSVYLARHRQLGNQVAIKVLSPAVAGHQSVRRFFEQEAKLQATLDHPGIVAVRDVISEDGVLALVMEYVAGTDLAGMIKESGGPMPLADVAAIFEQVLDAMSYAHGIGVVHRDLKPANIIVSRREGAVHVKVTDFGVARVTGLERFSGEWLIGTVAYLPPEQCVPGGQVDHRADIYALGVTLFEALTGVIPFDVADTEPMLLLHMKTPPPQPRELVAALPPGLEEVVLRVLEKDPARRFQSASELSRALLAAIPSQVTGRSTDRARSAESPSAAKDQKGHLVETLIEECSLPAMPTTGIELLRMIQRPYAELEVPQLARLIERDPVLTARLLKLANSPVYSQQSSVVSVARALTLVGLVDAVDLLYFLVVERTSSRFPSLKGFPVSAFWAHSWASAVVARQLGRPDLLVRSEPGTLYLAGLLHDVGKLVLASVRSSDYQRCLKRSSEARVPLADVERDCFGLDHGELGGRLLRHWGIPDEVSAAIRAHHAPLSAFEAHRELAGLVELADAITHHLHIGASGNPAPRAPDEVWIAGHGASDLSGGAIVRIVADLEPVLAHKVRITMPDTPEPEPARSASVQDTDPTPGFWESLIARLRSVFH
jgi:serine/threonine protein kinase